MFGKLLFVLFFCGFCSFAYSFEYTLHRGWNLFSPPLATAVSAQTWLGSGGADILSDVVRVWGFGGNGSSGWKSFVPGDESFLLEPGMGYWFYMREERTLLLSDQQTGLSLSMSGQGWHLVGSNSSLAISLDASGLFNPMYSSDSNSAIDSIRRIWGFYNNTWLSYAPGVQSQLNSLSPGRAYWFYLNSDLSVEGNSERAEIFPPVCPGCPSFSH